MTSGELRVASWERQAASGWRQAASGGLCTAADVLPIAMEDITGGERGPAAAELRRRFAASFELRTKRLMEDCARNEEGTECRHFRSVEMPVIGSACACVRARPPAHPPRVGVQAGIERSS